MKLSGKGKIIDGDKFNFHNFNERLYKVDEKYKLESYFRKLFSLYKTRYNNGEYAEAFMLLISMIEDKVLMLIILEIKKYSMIGELHDTYYKLMGSNILNNETKDVLKFMISDDSELVFWEESKVLTSKLVPLGGLSFASKIILLQHFNVLSEYKIDLTLIGYYRNQLAHNLFLNLSMTTKENVDDTLRLYKVLEKELNKNMSLLK